MKKLHVAMAGALCAVLVMSGRAGAEPLQKYPTPEEAMAHPIFVYRGCEQGEQSGCVRIAAPSSHSEGLQWIGGWAPEAQTRCTDRLTATLNLDCGDENAVRVLNIPRIVVGPPRTH